jgi:hypothetical protein
MDTITITNHGPLITATNFWESEFAERGLAYLSVNAGAFRLMIPDAILQWISEMRPGAKHVVVSMLRPEKWVEGQHCVEWMVEDGSDTPWACQLDPRQVDRLPLPDDTTSQWIASVWDGQRGRPHKCLERPAYFRFVTELPCLKPWTDNN